MEREQRQPFLEVRVHGIGSHDFLDALGTPPAETVGPGGRVITVDPESIRADNKTYLAAPPPIPEHPLRLVNWSRTTRASTGALWYLALPFTLCNMAGVMASGAKGSPGQRSGWTKWLQLAVTHVVGVLLTAMSVVWLGAIVETVLVHVPKFWPDTPAALTPNRVVAGSSFIACGGALAVGILARRFYRNGRSKVAVPLTLIHPLVAVGTAVCLVALGPVDRDRLQWLPGVTQQTGALDMVVTLTVVSSLLTVALSGLLWWAQVTEKIPLPDAGAGHSDRSPAYAANLVGGALALVMAMGLLHAVGALLRQVADGLLGLLKPESGVGTVIGRYDTLLVVPHLTTAPTGPLEMASESSRTIYVPLYGLFLLLVFVGALFAFTWWRRPPRAERPRAEYYDPDVRAGKDRAEFVHDTVCSLGRILSPALLTAGFLGAAGVWWFSSESAWFVQPGPLFVATIATNILAVLVGGLIFLRWPSTLARIVAMVADVVGFWTVSHHPLAGISYRHAVMSVLTQASCQQRADRVALVGHSQGSVLCAWFLSRDNRQLCEEEFVVKEFVDDLGGRRARFDLVTCGSPLKSLYCCFFPAWFHSDLFATVAANTAGWTNFWRTTDPIATTVGDVSTAPVANKELPDPGPSGSLVCADQDRDRPSHTVEGGVRAHGDYWVETEQWDHLENLALTALRSQLPHDSGADRSAVHHQGPPLTAIIIDLFRAALQRAKE